MEERERPKERREEMDAVRAISKRSVQYLEEQLSPLEMQIVDCVGTLRIATGGHLKSLFYAGENESAEARKCRWTLNRLYTLGVLSRYERRVGGVRSGSDGYIYRLGTQGHRLVRWWQEGVDVRTHLAPEVGIHTMDHALEVANFYVGLKAEEARRGRERLEVVSFDVERACWRDYALGLGQVRSLKPDAFVRVAVGDIERSWFVELDRGTVMQRTRSSHAADYRDYWRSGVAEDMPGVLWIAQNDLVAEAAKRAIQPHREPQGLFTLATIGTAVQRATEPVDGSLA
jgi:Replication-relaxation